MRRYSALTEIDNAVLPRSQLWHSTRVLLGTELGFGRYRLRD